jgi:hypothetical protein
MGQEVGGREREREREKERENILSTGHCLPSPSPTFIPREKRRAPGFLEGLQRIQVLPRPPWQQELRLRICKGPVIRGWGLVPGDQCQLCTTPTLLCESVQGKRGTI